MNIHLVSHGQGPAVVFFHGWGFDHHIWTPLVAKLSTHYQLILVDLPGFGLTPAMDWPVFKHHLLTHLPSSFAVMGWSMGGLYAQRLAIEAFRQVSSLMCIASSPHFIVAKGWPAVSQRTFTEFNQRLTLNAQKTLEEFIGLQLNNSKGACRLGVLPTSHALAQGLLLLKTWDFRASLHHLKPPACFLFGRLDPIIPVGIMHQMQLDYPNFNYVLFNRAAHLPFLSHRDLFIEAFKEFIV